MKQQGIFQFLFCHFIIEILELEFLHHISAITAYRDTNILKSRKFYLLINFSCLSHREIKSDDDLVYIYTGTQDSCCISGAMLERKVFELRVA